MAATVDDAHEIRPLTADTWAEYGTPEEPRPGTACRDGCSAADLIPDYRITCIFVDSFVDNGTRTFYETAGFEFVRPKGLRNTVMRRTVAPA